MPFTMTLIQRIPLLLFRPGGFKSIHHFNLLTRIEYRMSDLRASDMQRLWAGGNHFSFYSPPKTLFHCPIDEAIGNNPQLAGNE